MLRRCILRARDHIVYDGSSKASTGLTGVPVVANGRQILGRTYAATIERAALLPENLAVRQHIMQLCGQRLAIVLDEGDVEKIERKLNCGQLEELVSQAEAEYTLVDHMLNDAPWKERGFIEPTSIPIGIIHHENLEGPEQDDEVDYHTMVSDLMEEDAQAKPFEAHIEHEHIHDAYANLLYHIYEKPRQLLGDESSKINHLQSSSNTAIEEYLNMKVQPKQ